VNLKTIIENSKKAWLDDELASFKTPAVSASGLA
jgi:hypothetical protein